MQGFIFVKKNRQEICVIVTYGSFRFLDTFLIGLQAIKIGVIV